MQRERRGNPDGKRNIGNLETNGRLSIAQREIFEECGLTVELSDLAYVAAIDFEFKDDPVILEVHVFLTNKFEGTNITTTYTVTLELPGVAFLNLIVKLL